VPPPAPALSLATLTPGRYHHRVTSDPSARAPTRPRCSPRHRRAWLLALVLLALWVPRLAAAAPSTGTRPVIVPGREDEILALFEPHALGDELSPGWALASFSIEVSTVDLRLEGPDEATVELRLSHPDDGPAHAIELPSFDLEIVAREGGEGGDAAVEALVARMKANDDGQFWAKKVSYAEDAPGKPSVVGMTQSRLEDTSPWLRDGLLSLALLTVVILGLCADKLRGAPRSIKWSLAATVLGAALLRVGLSPRVALAPWPYTRELLSGARIFDGPMLALLTDAPVWLSDVILDSTLAYALLAPLAVYVHARYLLDDHRAGLLAALVVAVLPLHLRFSHSDAAFIPSITISSTVFALIHAATRERRAWLGWLALVVAAPLVVQMYGVRPLNIMYFPLLVATAFVGQGLAGDKPPLAKGRAIVTLVLLAALTFAVGVPRLLGDFGPQVDEGLGLQTLLSAIKVLSRPRFNTLLNPVFTPPLLVALALAGGWDLYRRGRRPLLWFLLAWLLGFLIAHAYVVPQSMYMQARYHLHLVVPFMLLAVCGIEAGLAWLAGPGEARPSWAGWTQGREGLIRSAALIWLLASPLIHLHAVRYTGLNDAEEWRFVHAQREAIPAECAILEYRGATAGARFRRVGLSVVDGERDQRWTIHEIPMPGEGEAELPVAITELLEQPPACLYYYEGLTCFGNKPPAEHLAPSCHAIPGYVELEEVAATGFDSVPYDDGLAFGLGEVDHIELRLYRVVGRR